MRRLVFFSVLVLAPAWANATDMPRVASVNVCTDQLVMLLADPEQIVSLSQLSDDPRSSVLADEAKAFPKNDAQAETLAVQAPDIVVGGAYNDPAMISLLRSIGISVALFPITSSLKAIPEEIRLMGGLLKQEAKAEALARRFERDLAKFDPPRPDAPLAAFFMPNGYALGAGTLSHDILVAGGARNLSVELGVQGNGTLSIEQVLLSHPDLLISTQPYEGFSRSEEMVTHPALAEFPVMNSTVHWVCGTPFVIDAIRDVSQQVRALDRR